MERIVHDGKWVISAFLILSCVPSHLTPLSVEATDFLTPLSKTALAKYQTEFKQLIQSDLDMLGLGKISNVGTPISPVFIKFRQSWAKTDPGVAPFLGSWSRDWNLHPYDFMTVFPSKTLGQVCLIRTRRDMTETVPFQEITTPPEFSIAQVVNGQLLGTQMQSARSLLFPTPASAYLPYDTEFIGTVERDGGQRLYAVQGLPSVDPTWDNKIRQQLNAYGCILFHR